MSPLPENMTTPSTGSRTDATRNVLGAVGCAGCASLPAPRLDGPVDGAHAARTSTPATSETARPVQSPRKLPIMLGPPGRSAAARVDLEWLLRVAVLSSAGAKSRA